MHAAPEIAAGDDVTIAISASAREPNVDRTIAIEFPSTWKFKRAWRVEAGSEHTDKIVPFGEVRSLIVPEPGESVIALADYTPDFNPRAGGIGYFIVFSTSPIPNGEQHDLVKAALVERISLDAIPKVNPKTKRPIEENHDWRMTFPSQRDFSFASITGKRLVTSILLEQMPRMQRALVVHGGRGGFAPLSGRPEIVHSFFEHPFSIQFWYRTNAPNETLLTFHTENGREIHFAIGLLGQVIVRNGTQIVLAVRSITNDGAWHYAALSNDSLGTLRLFVDNELAAIAHHSFIFRGVNSLDIGDSSSSEKDFTIDELHLVRNAYREPSDFESYMTFMTSDSLHPPFALFHFDDYGMRASSNVAETEPLYFTLDSLTSIRETTSPVEPEPVRLAAELPAPSTVHLEWSRTSELGIKEYQLQLRVGTYGRFDALSTVPARHGMKISQRGESIVSWNQYNVLEQLPKMNGDIDLYFRVAAIGFNKRDAPQYSLPVKVEYALDRDVFVEQNKPEPFQDSTVIALTLTKPELVRLSIFDMIGREIAVLANERLGPGRHIFLLNAKNWPNGIYFYKIKTSRATITRKMTIIR